VTAATLTVDEQLAAYATATAALVAQYTSGREPRRHLYEPVRAFTMRQGKGLRPALCLATCEAFGGTVDDTLPAAAALELLHAAFLIHDDIEDGSEKRRGRSAMHVEYGVPIALNAGDALATLSLRPLLDATDRLGSRMTRTLLTEFQRTMERTVEGQAIEIGWRTDNVVDLTPRDYLDMILLKTCAYTTILPLRVGALVGSWGTADLDAIAQYGFALGAAFQIQDDVLDLVSASGSYGKDLLGDIREGKRTLVLVHLARNATSADRAFLEDFLALPPAQRGERPVRRVADMMQEYGSIAFATAYAAEMAESARLQFDVAFAPCPDSPALRFLRALVPFMVERTA
jgi:geranylgeranyl diphosphate synthase type II